jgi:hypothetical protein
MSLGLGDRRLSLSPELDWRTGDLSRCRICSLAFTPVCRLLEDDEGLGEDANWRTICWPAMTSR